GRSEHILCGCFVGRCVEDDRWWIELADDLRQPGCCSDRSAGCSTELTEHCVGRHGRGMGDSRHRCDGRWSLRVCRCGQDVEEHGAEGVGPHRADRYRPEECGQHLCVRAWAPGWTAEG